MHIQPYNLKEYSETYLYLRTSLNSGHIPLWCHYRKVSLYCAYNKKLCYIVNYINIVQIIINIFCYAFKSSIQIQINLKA